MLRLYDNLSSGNGYKCRWLLTQLGLPFERVEVDIDRGESRTPGFLAINPNGRIPVLRVGPDDHLAESNAILRYLAEGTPFWPEGKREKAAVLQWLFWEQYSHEPNIATARFWITHRLEMTPERAHALVMKREMGHAALRQLEGHVLRQDWLVGDRCTIADVALYAYTHVAEEGGFDLDRYPAVRRWLDRFAAQPDHIQITDRVGTERPFDPALFA
ncbi:glutathione S-transferase family protein [Oleisolibacter albus]|uniref:glutathione S-transferase family protein n=1 Tax=Oleisolibacter albus TaxID=2171757 RepID=UPI000DF16890|nr:glutathione S-transferase family protein [Oleisolibacter albus]